MRKLWNSLSSVKKITKLIWSTEPQYFGWTFPQIFINVILRLLYVYAPKLIIEKLTNGSTYRDVLFTILLYAACLLVLNIVLKIAQEKSRFCAGEFARRLKLSIGKATASLPLYQVEDKAHREIINLAKNAASLTETMGVAERMITNVITIIGLSAIIVQLDMILLASVAFVLAVKIIITYLRFAYDKKMQIQRNENQLQGEYLNELAYFSPGAEKEIRINNLEVWFMDKVKTYRHDMLVWQYRDFRRYAAFESLMAIITVLQSLVLLLILSNRYIGGDISIADFTMYFNAVISLGGALSAVADQVSALEKQTLNFSHLEKLFDLHSKAGTIMKESTDSAVPNEKLDIVFDNVSFSYGEDAPLVLDHINLTIKSGEKLVIVGMNGAGKTTLIKLLCKFYRPTAGRILIGGRDIETIPNDEYYKLIAAVFQDHREFSFTVAENISLSKNGDTDKIEKILAELDLAGFISRLPNGLCTYVGRNFSNEGIDPSGGEGQKLAIAKAMYKDSPILILDEPTASLDALAESEIYEQFFKLSATKTTIFISHRLAASTIADRIVVFDKGNIVEHGTHKELMKNDGLYAKMYLKQSKLYANTIAMENDINYEGSAD